jgi:hypothetical protein
MRDVVAVGAECPARDRVPSPALAAVSGAWPVPGKEFGG